MASVPVPAPCSRRTNGSGRPSRSHASRQDPRQGGAEDRVGLGRGQEVAVAARPRRLGPVVAAVRVVQREVHEAGERDRAGPGDLVADPRDERRRPGRRRRGRAARRDGGPVSAPRRRPIAPRPSSRRTPGPTSVCPPSRIGIGRLPRRPPSGSAATGRRSGRASSRSEANRSSAAGQAASSAPSRWASSTRVSTIAASPSRARIPPSASGPSRSRSIPSSEAGRRWMRRRARSPASSGHAPAARSPAAHVPRRSPGSGPGRDAPARRASPPRPDRRRAAPPGGPSPPPGPRPGDPRSGRRSTSAGAPRRPEQDQLERSVDVERQPPPAAQVGDREAGDLREPARQRVVAGQVRDVRERLRAGDRHDVGRVAVVGEGRRAVGAGGRHQVRDSRARSRAGSRRIPGRPARPGDRHGRAPGAGPRTVYRRAAR